MKIVLYASIAVCFLPSGTSAADEPFQPQFPRATLRDGNRVVAPERVVSPWKGLYKHDGRRFVIDGDAVVEVRADYVPIRKSPKCKARGLRWLGAVGDTAYVARAPHVSKNETARADLHLAAEILRLDVNANEWRSPLTPAATDEERPKPEPAVGFGDDEQPPGKRIVILGEALVTSDGLVALTYEVEDRAGFGGSSVFSYQLTYYKHGAAKHSWRKTYDFRGSHSSGLPDAAYLDDSGSNLYNDTDGIIPLSVIHTDYGQMLVACAGGKQDVLCVSVDSGEELWRINRLWEFERWFTPGEYEEYVTRFGTQFVVERRDKNEKRGTPERKRSEEAKLARKSKTRFRELRARFRKDYEGAITGGPLLIPPPDRTHDPLVFVATSIGRREDEHGALHFPRGVTYRISLNSGDIELVSPLPRPTAGRPEMTTDGAALWVCKERSLFREGRHNTNWYREYHDSRVGTWFTAGPYKGIRCVSDLTLWRPNAALVKRQGDSVYSFLLDVVDLKTGLDRPLTLAVPFPGEFTLSEHGIRSMSDGRTTSIRTAFPHLMGISDLQIDGTTLRVIMRNDETRALTAIEFELSSSK